MVMAIIYAFGSVHEEIDVWIRVAPGKKFDWAAPKTISWIDSNIELLIRLKFATLGSAPEKFDVWTAP